MSQMPSSRGSFLSYSRSILVIFTLSMILLTVSLFSAKHHSLPFSGTQEVLHSGTKRLHVVHFNHGADRGNVPLKSSSSQEHDFLNVMDLNFVTKTPTSSHMKQTQQDAKKHFRKKRGSSDFSKFLVENRKLCSEDSADCKW
ncbi:hypothetical protein O6H91_13G025300 [Diphasiastrum complanatum]|uniref:Uncharacterized protein n=1 Tax=Diphasiastrum complanatum TaxID=34168 RepID=A0ACC2BT31_DIPCM|nr:hypothetical protein O6H91_13G025300 [Diphasiastrum complanatum]